MSMSALIILSAFTVSCSYCQINAKSLVKSAKPAVVTIHCYNSKHEEYGTGTGFFITTTQLVTDRHVIAEASEARCIFSDSVEMVIDGIVAEDSAADLVILECKKAASGHFHPLKLAKQLPEEGEEIIVIGSPLDFGHSVSQGIVSSIRQNSPVGTAIQFTAAVSFGSSGSPVLNPKGEVVGIVSLLMNNAENINFAAVASSARNLRPKALMTFPQWLHKNDGTQSVASESKLKTPQADPFDKNAFLGEYAYGRGEDYMKEKKFAEAANMYATAVNQQSDNADAWFGLGHALGSLEKYAEAADALDHAVKLRPKFSRAWLYLGKALANSGDAGKAEDALTVATKDGSTAAFAWFALGQIYYHQTRCEKAVDAFTRSAELNIVDTGLFEELSECYYKLGNMSEARRAVKAALSINPYYRDGPQQLAACDMQLHEIKEGTAYLEAALRHSPNDVQVMGALGDYYREDKRTEEAIKILKHAIELAPMSGMLHEGLGMAFIESGNREDANKELYILGQLQDIQRTTELHNYIVGFKK